MFSEPEIAKTFNNSGFPLMDLTTIPDEEIIHHQSMATLTLLQKHFRQRELKEVLNLLALLIAAEFMIGQQMHALVISMFRLVKLLMQVPLSVS